MKDDRIFVTQPSTIGGESVIADVRPDIGIIELDGSHETGASADGLGGHIARKDYAATVVEIPGVGV